MLPPKLKPSADQQRLLHLFRQLPVSERQSLLSYAEFLFERTGPQVRGAAERALPRAIPRPESESVVAAMRRLSQTFPMLDKDGLFHEASALMTAHVMQGRPAAEVIDELEVVFRRHYERVSSPSE
jgi:hypothetical protein